jgi:hypothetical protein
MVADARSAGSFTGAFGPAQNLNPHNATISEPSAFDAHPRERENGRAGRTRRHGYFGRSEGWTPTASAIRSKRIAGMEVGTCAPPDARDRRIEIHSLASARLFYRCGGVAT